jgi:hypothetical protein
MSQLRAHTITALRWLLMLRLTLLNLIIFALGSMLLHGSAAAVGCARSGCLLLLLLR